MTAPKQKSSEIQDIKTIDPVSKTKESVQLIGYKQEFLESLLNYLNTKPHGEVRGFIDGIQQGQPVEI